MARPTPKSIVIIGGGVFGLGTAFSLTKRSAYASTKITLIDRALELPAVDGASNDSSRIIRADYADPLYAKLGEEAMPFWRDTTPGALGDPAGNRYYESGMLLIADDNAEIDAARAANAATRGIEKWHSGKDYVAQSVANVSILEVAAGRDPEKTIIEYSDAKAISESVSAIGHVGDVGYLNTTAGWANAGNGIAWLYEQVKATGRVNFIFGTATKLLRDDAAARVLGVELADDTKITADLTMVAIGAWSGRLVDLEGRATATGQALAYVNMDEKEFAATRNKPVILNLSNGLFIIPPVTPMLKLARHAYGYVNPTPVPNALPTAPGKPITPVVSIPLTTSDDPNLKLPAEGIRDLRRLLDTVVSEKSLASKDIVRTRICWYSDTPTGDWIVDYHAGWEGLFIATGDSGHAFKFLPVLGEKVVDVMTGVANEKMKSQWRWRGNVHKGLVVTEDGSRAGTPGLVLKDLLKKEMKI